MGPKLPKKKIQKFSQDYLPFAFGKIDFHSEKKSSRLVGKSHAGVVSLSGETSGCKRETSPIQFGSGAAICQTY